MKARLTGRQVVAAIFAGIVGHVLFAAGWVGLGLILFGGLVLAVLGGAVGGIGPETFTAVIDNLRDTFGAWLIGLAIGAGVLMVLGFVLSGLILRGGAVRKPWGTTFTSILIAAVLALPLLLLYGLIAGNAADGQPRFTVVAIIGTAVVGVLVWLWMTWAHRGSASEFADRRATATGTARVAGTESDPAVEPARPSGEPPR